MVFTPLLIAMALAVVEGDDARNLAAALRAGIEQWESDVSFAATFETRSVTRPTVDEALHAPFDQDEETAARPSRGRLAKMGSFIRFERHYEGGPIEVPHASIGVGQKAYRYMASAEITDGRIEVRYTESRDRAYPKEVFVDLRSEKLHDTLLSGVQMQGVVSPITPVGERASRLLDCQPPKGPHWEVSSTERVGTDRVILLMNSVGEPRIMRRLTIRTDVSPPVVVRIEDDRRTGDTEIPMYIVELSDFVQCEGGIVARRAVTIRMSPDGTCSADLWRSSDLGDRPPTQNDFVLPITKQTKFYGLKDTAAVYQAGQLDLNTILIADLSSDPSPPPVATSEQGRASASYRLLAIWLNAAIVAILLCVVLFRYARR